MKRLQLLVFYFCLPLFLCLSLGFFSSCQPSTQTIRIAASANLKPALTEIQEVFFDQKGISCQMVFNSSGKLSAQIKSGAPYDIFLSANMDYPNKLFMSGIGAEAPHTYALGRLVLWSENKELGLDQLGTLAKGTQRIAIANPQLAPYGKASFEVLQNLNLWEDHKDKMAYGESIAQATQFIMAGAVQLGFTSLSYALSPSFTQRGSWQKIPEELHSPLAQGALLITKEGKNAKKARAFLDFLSSPEAEAILVKQGYQLPSTP